VLILYDWALTSGDELTFVWRRSKNNYARILFIFIAIICSELILATRAWAIWARNRRILTFLAIFIPACLVPAIVGVAYAVNITPTFVTPSVAMVLEDGTVVRCDLVTGPVKRFLVMIYVSIMAIEAVVVALSLFKIFQYYQGVPRKTRSKLLDVLWIDGLMYFVFMLLVGILNLGLVLHSSNSSLYVGSPELQTALHSILSTRIVLHTTTVLRQDISDSRATVAQDRASNRMEFARDTIELVAQ